MKILLKKYRNISPDPKTGFRKISIESDNNPIYRGEEIEKIPFVACLVSRLFACIKRV
jgi:hypothetical protein